MKFLVAIATVLTVSLAAWAWLYFGGFNVAASAPHGPASAWLLDTAMERSVTARADRRAAPSRFTPLQVQAGFRAYDGECVMCHGAPGVEPADWAQGLNPRPPDLARAAGRWEPAELFWIVKHGVKMTGMPAMGAHHSDPQIWNIVAFVETLPRLGPEDYRRMRGPAEAPPTGGRDHEH